MDKLAKVRREPGWPMRPSCACWHMKVGSAVARARADRDSIGFYYERFTV